MARAAALGAAFGAARSPVAMAGELHGRVAPATPGRSVVTVQRRVGQRWVTLLDVPVGAGGRYAARLARAGLYRVVYDGAAGPSVLLR
jgi:hypothetical protein